MKTAVIYYSYHHGNTEKVVKRLAEKFSVDLINTAETDSADLSEYDIIGFAAGISFGKLYSKVTEFSKFVTPGKKLFAIYTCGKDSPKYGEEIKTTALEKGCEYIGKFGCKGYDTYGPLKLIGGINKEKSTEEELSAAEEFFTNIIKA